MSDNDNKPAAELPAAKVEAGVSEDASANAPFILFDEISGFGSYNGIAHMTLEALRFMNVNGKLRTDRVAVAHLRMNLVALKVLKDTIAKIELLAQPVPEGPKN